MHPLQIRLLDEIQKIPNMGTRSLRAIGELIGTSSPQVVKHHLMQLERRGLIVFDRSNKIIRKTQRETKKDSATLLTIPILGYANCGVAAEIAEQRPDGFLRCSIRLIPHSRTLFAIRAIGNSLNKARVGQNKRNIESGDFAIIDYSTFTPRNGDYVLSIIDGLANLKKFHFDKANEQIVLISESTQYFDPIYIHQKDGYQIGGKIVAVLKNPTS